MNETENEFEIPAEPQIPEMQSGPGQRLRLAREQKNLSLGDAAERLHIQPHLLEGLENDDYSAMPGNVFVQGYLRKYARLLDEPADEIVETFNSQRPSTEYTPTLRKFEMKMKTQQANGGNWLLKAFSWLVVLGLILLALAWWQGYVALPMLGMATDQASNGNGEAVLSEAPASARSAETPPSEAQPPSEEPNQSDTPSVTEQGTAVVIETPQDPSGSLAPENIVESRGTPPSESSVENNEPQVANLEETSDEAAPISEATKVPATQPTATGDNLVVLEFDAPCWVDIRDATGEKVLYGGVGKGEIRPLGGTAPYQVVLGNSEAVRVVVGGSPFDLAPHSRGRVARFTLDPTKIESSGTGTP